jgi:hypothetical protein
MQIGQGALWTGRVHPVVVLLQDLPWFLGAIGNKRSVALSTTEAEYIVLCVEVHRAVWIHKLLAELFGHEMDFTIIHCDNQSCVNISENPMFNDKSKHNEIWCRGKNTCEIPFYTQACCKCLHQTACQDEV